MSHFIRLWIGGSTHLFHNTISAISVTTWVSPRRKLYPRRHPGVRFLIIQERFHICPPRIPTPVLFVAGVTFAVGFWYRYLLSRAASNRITILNPALPHRDPLGFMDHVKHILTFYSSVSANVIIKVPLIIVEGSENIRTINSVGLAPEYHFRI